MGNLFSKRLSLKDKLIELEDSTIKTQYELSTLKRTTHLKSTLVFSSILVLALCYSFSYNLILCFILIALFETIWIFSIRIATRWRIEGKERRLAEMNEIRKVLIEQCKKDTEFSVTKSIIERYEEEESRNTFFKQLQKKKQTTMDSVTDFVLGKDPSKMNALICKNCGIHNGLIDPKNEEFKEFRCYNCEYVNVRK